MSYQDKHRGHPGQADQGHQKFLQDNIEHLLNLSKSDKAVQLIDHIKGFVNEKCGDLSTHQLRQLYMEVKKADTPTALQLLRPNFAYMGARQSKISATKAVEFFDEVIQAVGNDPVKLAEFKNFMEAVVAYHKLYKNN